MRAQKEVVWLGPMRILQIEVFRRDWWENRDPAIRGGTDGPSVKVNVADIFISITPSHLLVSEKTLVKLVAHAIKESLLKKSYANEMRNRYDPSGFISLISDLDSFLR